uniref:hypothetical protein n=1 Tax=Bacillus cereus group TaxID=86661 RepID=UPI001953945E
LKLMDVWRYPMPIKLKFFCDWAHSNGYHLDGPFIKKYYTDEFITLDKYKNVTEFSIATKIS